jgi:hypothetical protein
MVRSRSITPGWLLTGSIASSSARLSIPAVPVRDAQFALTMTPHGRHTALATRTLGVAASRSQDERC